MGPSVLLRARELDSLLSLRLVRASGFPDGRSSGEELKMFQESQDDEQIFARVAALDIGKAELVCCSRVPSPDRAGRRLQEVTTCSTMTRSLQGPIGCWPWA